MRTTIEFLEAVQQRHGLTSDYQLAQFLSITRASVSLLMQGKTRLGDETACKVADALALDRGYVLSCVAAERARCTAAREAWQRAAKRLARAAIVLIVLGIGLWQPATVEILGAVIAAGENIHYTQ